MRQLQLPLCRSQWEHLAQQPAEENKDFKQRMKEVGLHLFTARSALPGTEVLQQVLQIGEAEAADIIHASGPASKDNTSSLAARIPAAKATRTHDQAVRSALTAECDGPEDADYKYSSDANEEYEEGGAEEQETAAEPMQQCESQEEKVLLMQPLPHGFEVRAMLERRPNGTALRTYFTAQCTSHAVTKKLTSPVHLMRFLDKHGPHMCAPLALSFYKCSACCGACQGAPEPCPHKCFEFLPLIRAAASAMQ